MRRFARHLRSVAAIAVLIALLLAYAWSEEIGIGTREISAGAERVEVRDGDTFLIGGTEFRLSGIDAPEYHQNCTDAGGRSWPCGKEARAKLAVLLGGTGLTCTPRAKDRFDRSIAVCRNDRFADIGSEMVHAGLAISPGDFGEAPYADAERDARTTRRGIWQGSFIAPAEWRKANPRADAPSAGLDQPAGS